MFAGRSARAFPLSTSFTGNCPFFVSRPVTSATRPLCSCAFARLVTATRIPAGTRATSRLSSFTLSVAPSASSSSSKRPLSAK
jgi:hypothetical protein